MRLFAHTASRIQIASVRLSLLCAAIACGNMFALAGQPPSCRENAPVASVSYSGLSLTDPKVVTRELLNGTDRAFSAADYAVEKRRLEGLDLFSDIDLICTERGDSLALEYRFKELFHWIPSPAGKKTDQDGWMLGLALAHLNVGGEDIRSEVQYRQSIHPWMDSKEYAFYNSSPWLFDYPVSWNVEFLRTDSWDDLRGYYDRSWYAHADLTGKLCGPLSLLWAASYRYLEGEGNIPDLGAGFVFDDRDSPVDSRNGAYEEFRLTRTGGFADSPENYLEWLWDNRLYLETGRFVTHLSSLARYRPGEQKFYDRLQQGGANSLRGFDPDSSVHGRHEILLNAEERFVLLPRTSFTVFGANLFWGVQLVAGADGSFLWDKDGVPGWEDYRSAVYAGVHFIIPALDRLRIEVGYSPDGDGPLIAVGLFEKNVSQRWRSR